MKITKSQLKQIIKEELEEAMRTAGPPETAAVLQGGDADATPNVDMRALADEYKEAYLEPIFTDILKEYPATENKEMTRIQFQALRAALVLFADDLKMYTS